MTYSKLIDLFEQKDLDTTFILKKMFKTCLALNDMKEVKIPNKTSHYLSNRQE